MHDYSINFYDCTLCGVVVLLSLKPVFGLLVWTAVSHGFLLARSRGIGRFLLEDRKHWSVVSHMPHVSLGRC